MLGANRWVAADVDTGKAAKDTGQAAALITPLNRAAAVLVSGVV
jgi:hypothetical protein